MQAFASGEAPAGFPPGLFDIFQRVIGSGNGDAGNIMQFFNQYQGDPNAHVPAGAAAIESLKKFKVPEPERSKVGKEDDEEEETCSVCLCSLDHGEEGLRMPCNHPFHAPCLLTWLKTDSTCPLCRHQLEPDPAPPLPPPPPPGVPSALPGAGTGQHGGGGGAEGAPASGAPLPPNNVFLSPVDLGGGAMGGALGSALGDATEQIFSQILAGPGGAPGAAPGAVPGAAPGTAPSQDAVPGAAAAAAVGLRQRVLVEEPSWHHRALHYCHRSALVAQLHGEHQRPHHLLEALTATHKLAVAEEYQEAGIEVEQAANAVALIVPGVSCVQPAFPAE